MEKIVSRRAALVCAAIAVVFAVAGGIAYAAIPDSGGVYHACMLKAVGTIRIIDPEKQHCSTTLEVEITFNQRGQAGANGLNGTNGVDGKDGAAGADGKDGVSPTIADLGPGNGHCDHGGASITDATGKTIYICNGAPGAKGDPGSPFSGSFTSPNGQYSLNVSDTGVTIAHGPTKIELVGDDVTIRSNRNTSIQTGDNLTLKASSNFSLEGSATGSVKAGSILDLTGALVDINGSSCLPAARIGDQVTGIANPVLNGQIATGSLTVCIG